MSTGSPSVLDWVNLYPNNQTLMIEPAPVVTEQTEFQFGLKASWGSESALKQFYITVLPCQVEMCNR